MLTRLRDMTASALSIVAARVATEPRHPALERVASSGRTLAGVQITPDTAVTVPAVWACLRYLSQTVAFPPWHVFRDGPNGAEIQDRNPVDWLLCKRPSGEWSSFQFRETLTHWALRWGNGYAEIERDTLGRPFALWPIHPERVAVCRDKESGELYYEVENGTEPKIEIAARDMFHVRGFGEGPVGVNVIHYAAQSIGWARAAQLFGATFFGNGAHVSSVVINKKPLKLEGLKRQKAEFEALYKGPRNANKTAFLDNDADVKTLGIEPDKAQFILTHQHLIEEICRWFGVPPHKVAHLLRATFSNIEHQSIEVVVDSITPWAKRFEDEADYKLFGQNRPGLYTKINLNALMRGDSKARVEFYKGMVDIGAFTANRVLRLEDENTIGPDGDKHVMQSQYTTLERIGEEPVEVAAPAPAAAAAPSSPDNLSADEITAMAEITKAVPAVIHA